MLFWFMGLMVVGTCFAQNPAIEDSLEAVDSLYLEDQYYIGISYNIMQNRPVDVSQRNLSYGLRLGFIRDLPINKRRNKAIGIGLGYGANTYYDNLRAVKQNDGSIIYEVITEGFTKNKLSTHLIEMPIQYRWRTSTPTSYKFWRIYTGIKIGYSFSNTYVFVDDDESIKFTNTNLDNLQYGLSLSIGYNTSNFYVYYGLNDMYKNAFTSTGEGVKTKELKIGLIFYVL